MTFKELNIADSLLKAISEKGYHCPTPIQIQGIPVALSGKDILGIAQTGTGKTAAFAIPILQHLSQNNASFSVSQDTQEKKSFSRQENNPGKKIPETGDPSPNPDSYPRISLTNRRFLY